jgi:predicted nucleic acid-binding protein
MAENGRERKYMSADKTFIDTNVPIYTLDFNNSLKQEQTVKIIKELVVLKTAVVSTQVLQKFYNTAVKKLKFDKLKAKTILLNYKNFETLEIDFKLI